VTGTHVIHKWLYTVEMCHGSNNTQKTYTVYGIFSLIKSMMDEMESSKDEEEMSTEEQKGKEDDGKETYE